MKRRHLLSLLLAAGMLFGTSALAAPTRFEIAGEHFLLDGKPYVIRSGEMHYPRIPREYWRDRLQKAKAMGLNTITTYVFWNLHEQEPGRFDFRGNLDVAEFVRMAGEEGLHVIVRPGPYICTEVDLGGYPAWLLRTNGLRIRSMDPRYMAASANYLKRVGKELAPLLGTRGGPIIMAQIENEYGSYGNDHDYMRAMRQQMIDAGFDVPLFTSDGPGLNLLEGGTLDGVTSIINFMGTPKDAESSFKSFAEFRTGVPRMVGEYWAGWFDHWGEQHHTIPVATVTDSVEWFLKNGVSFNLYMFHGGSSFGYLAGANHGGNDNPYQPDTTSYDYDSPVDEAGRLTPKYLALRALIGKYLPPGETLPPLPKNSRTIAIAPFALTEQVALLDALPQIATDTVQARTPKNMEALGQNYGFVLYRRVMEAGGKSTLTADVRDYATVMENGRPVGTLDRRKAQRDLQLELSAGSTLDMLVENMGRIGFGRFMDQEYKGILGMVRWDKQALSNWTIYTLPLDNLAALKFSPSPPATMMRAPTFWRGHFNLSQPGDTFIDTRAWGKGHLWVNGHHVGRYWKIGPQQTLYVPASWLRKGRNEIVLLDVEGGKSGATLSGLANPVFDTPAPVK